MRKKKEERTHPRWDPEWDFTIFWFFNKILLNIKSKFLLKENKFLLKLKLSTSWDVQAIFFVLEKQIKQS